VAQLGGIQALLLGGLADGRAIRLQELHRELFVFVNGEVRVESASVVAARGEPVEGGFRYRLVEPVGPEMPVYVQS
jgi:hypothetical protein